MANEEHLAILKKGVGAWNEWRRETSEIPDLSGADLHDGSFIGGDFRRANLSGANLRGAQLPQVKLYDADLTRSNLRQANLEGAYFGGANLSEAVLHRANLRGANLTSSLGVRADAREVILDGGDLTEADFRGADLSGAYLRNTILVGTNLAGATMHVATLAEADLTGAILRSANLSRTRLERANMKTVDLHNAVISGAVMLGSNLKGCGMERTVIADVDLSGVVGLEEVLHLAPSTIGIDTIYRSKGKIPEVFLRGAGVPEPFIANMKALVAAMEPIEFYSCFISYSTKDQEFADRLYADLQRKNVRCWFAPEDLKIGDKFRMRIDEAIRVHDKLLLVLTESSVKSAWVEKEVETAFERERMQGRTVLFPIRLDNTVMMTGEAWAADIRRTRHIGDFSGWKNHDSYRTAFDRLLRDLQTGGEA